MADGVPEALLPWVREAARGAGATEVVVTARAGVDGAVAHWALAALLRLEHGDVSTHGSRILLRGAARNAAARASLELELGPLPDVALDGTRLSSEEGRVEGSGVSDLLDERGRPAEVDEAGRVRAGRYHFADGHLVLVPAGRTTRVTAGAGAVIADGQHYQLDDDVRVIPFDAPGGLSHAKPHPRGNKALPLMLASSRYQRRWSNPHDEVTLLLIQATGGVDAHEAFALDVDHAVGDHFIIDFDGTIYQTADLSKQVRSQQPELDNRMVSIGIVGIRSIPSNERDRPPFPADHARAAELARHPRPRVRGGTYNGAVIEQAYGMTDAQRRSLGTLVRTLGRLFPAFARGPIRGVDGEVPPYEVRDIDRQQGICGAYHLSGLRVDPGPMIDWDALAPDWQ